MRSMAGTHCATLESPTTAITNVPAGSPYSQETTSTAVSRHLATVGVERRDVLSGAYRVGSDERRLDSEFGRRRVHFFAHRGPPAEGHRSHDASCRHGRAYRDPEQEAGGESDQREVGPHPERQPRRVGDRPGTAQRVLDEPVRQPRGGDRERHDQQTEPDRQFTPTVRLRPPPSASATSRASTTRRRRTAADEARGGVPDPSHLR